MYNVHIQNKVVCNYILYTDLKPFMVFHPMNLTSC